jgi:magnesium transporter
MSENLNQSIRPSAQEKTFGLSTDLVAEITTALEENKRHKVRDLIGTMHTADIAELLNQVDADHRRVLVAVIRDEFDPEILRGLEGKVVDEVMEALGAAKAAEAITQLDSDDAIQVIEELEKLEQQEILEAIPEEQRQLIEEGLAYDEKSAGRLMNVQYVAIPEDWDVGQTIDYLRAEKSTLPTDFYQIFVINKQKIPVGNVLVSRVIRSSRSIGIRNLMETEVQTINADTDQEDVAYMFRKYALVSAPVVDKKGRIVGVIAVDDVVDVIDEEAEEDLMLLGGVSETGLYTSFWETAVRRFPWLFINLLTAVAASYVISFYEESIEKIVALAVLMPIVASMGGNAGTQTLTIAVRGLATKELTATNARRVLLKEVLSSTMNGFAFAVIVGLIVLLLYKSLFLAGAFALAMVVNLFAAGLAGVGIPLILERMKIDPAIASAVFLTTVTDIVGFFAFLGTATWILL